MADSSPDTAPIHFGWKDYLLPPLDSEGPGFVLVFGIVSFLLWLLWTPLGLIGLALTVWCFYFFRDPVRNTPDRAGLLISPADGRVQMIQQAAPPAELGLPDTPLTRVSVFMSVFDCHVNRAPIAGTIQKIAYTPGRFLNATLDKASEDNERQSFLLETDKEVVIPFVQIAGLVARRIRADVTEGQTVGTGERCGLIRFGSRVDIYLPKGTAPLVAPGQIMVAGETVIADLKSKEKARPSQAN